MIRCHKKGLGYFFPRFLSIGHLLTQNTKVPKSTALEKIMADNYGQYNLVSLATSNSRQVWHVLASKPTLCQDSLECREFDAWLFKNLASLPLYIFPSFVDDYSTICLSTKWGWQVKLRYVYTHSSLLYYVVCGIWLGLAQF